MIVQALIFIAFVTGVTLLVLGFAYAVMFIFSGGQLD